MLNESRHTSSNISTCVVCVELRHRVAHVYSAVWDQVGVNTVRQCRAFSIPCPPTPTAFSSEAAA